MFFRALIILYLLATLKCNCIKERTNLLVKTPLDRTQIHPCLGAYDFEDLFADSSAIVDKSLLIKKLLESNSKVASITYPRGWGKSINLNMLGMFLRLEVRKDGVIMPREECTNYRLFMKGELSASAVCQVDKPFLISKHEDFCDKYLGKYPVITLALDLFKGRNFKEMLKEMEDLIIESFAEHDYMIGVYEAIINSTQSTDEEKTRAKEKLDVFEKYLNGEFELVELQNSLATLADILYDHLGKPSIVLIDDFDKPMIHMLKTCRVTDEDQNWFINFFTPFLSRTFNATHVERSFLTGTLKLATDQLLSPLKDVVDYNFFDNELSEFFGFHHEEVESLMEHFQVAPEDRKKAYEFYNGYGASSNRSLRIYNTLSISTYFYRKREVDRYCIEPDDVNYFLGGFFDISIFRKAASELINGMDVEICKNALDDLSISFEEFKLLRSFLTFHQSVEHSLIASSAFKFLFAHGYLSLTNKRTSEESTHVVESSKMKFWSLVISDQTVNLRLANKEVSADLNQRLNAAILSEAMRDERETR